MKRLLVMLSIVIVVPVYSAQPRPLFTDRAAYKKWLDDQSRAKKGEKNGLPKPPVTQAQFDVGVQKCRERGKDFVGLAHLLSGLHDEERAFECLNKMREQGIWPTTEFIAKLEKTLGKEPGSLKEFLNPKN